MIACPVAAAVENDIFCISQGSLLTFLDVVDRFRDAYVEILQHSVYQKLYMPVYFWRSYSDNKNVALFWNTVYVAAFVSGCCVPVPQQRVNMVWRSMPMIQNLMGTHFFMRISILSSAWSLLEMWNRYRCCLLASWELRHRSASLDCHVQHTKIHIFTLILAMLQYELFHSIIVKLHKYWVVHKMSSVQTVMAWEWKHGFLLPLVPVYQLHKRWHN